MQQADIEESARAELWREELIEEIEQKVGSLRELEEAGKEEELVKWSNDCLIFFHCSSTPSNIQTLL